MAHRRIVRDDRRRRHRRRRARLEHAIARWKYHRILRDCRRRGVTIDDVTRATAVLHNLKLECAT